MPARLSARPPCCPSDRPPSGLDRLLLTASFRIESVMNTKRPVLSIVLLALALVGSASSVRAMTCEELREALREGEKITVVDIRSRTRFRRGHLVRAMNFPAETLAGRKLPPLGRVVVCGDGVDLERTRAAVTALAAKPGITAEILDGGWLRWEALGYASTAPKGLQRSPLRFVDYDDVRQMARTRRDVVLVDLRASELTPSAEDARARAPEATTDTRAVADVVEVSLARGRGGASVIVLGPTAVAEAKAAERGAVVVKTYELPPSVVGRFEKLASDSADVTLVDARTAAAPTSKATAESAETVVHRPLTEIFPGAAVRRLRVAAEGVAPEAARPSSAPENIAAAGAGGAARVPELAIREARTAQRGRALVREFLTLRGASAAAANHGELYVLVDDGDGHAQRLARRLKSAGVRRCVILTGGEKTIQSEGRPVFGTR